MLKKLNHLASGLLFVGSLLLMLNPVSTVRADSAHSTSLIIVKYGLSAGATGFAADQTTNTGGYINNLPITDNTGKELSLVPDISYTVQEIASVPGKKLSLSDASSYTKVANPQTITTASNGEAAIRLTDGFYIVSEQENDVAGLKTPAVPVLIQLPQWSATSELDSLYLYPKSSVVKSITPPSSSTTPPSSNQVTPPPSSGSPIRTLLNQILPHTGDVVQWGAMMLGGVLIVVALLIKRKKKEN